MVRSAQFRLKHVLLHTTACSFKCLDIGRQAGFVLPNSGGQLGVQYKYTKEPFCDRLPQIPGFAWSDVAVVLRVLRAVVLRCCCSVAEGLR